MSNLCGLLLLLAAASPGEDPRLSHAQTLDGDFPWTPPASAEAWSHRRAEVRRRVLVAAGLWPAPESIELAPPVIHGAIQRAGYTVEKVYFESLPGFHVTGNLYRPEGPGPFPAVLSPHGHWTDGRFSAISDEDVIAQLERGEEREFANARFHLQARCATLARAGYVVFHYDMLGYADSRQIVHDQGFGDVEAELWGMSALGLQTLNSIRSLDFLLDLSEVDPTRIAVTGGSGGGTQTFILGAVDDRPSLLFPAVMVSTSMQGGCTCENASHLRIGTGNIELAAMAAPRPLGMTAANDWTRELMTRGFPELKELYERLGVGQDVTAWCYPEQPHNYNAIARGHLYEFLAQHFGGDPAVEEAEIVPVERGRLSVYDAEHPRPAGGIADVRREWVASAKRELVRLARLVETDPAEFQRVVGGALETLVAARVLIDAQQQFERLGVPVDACTLQWRSTGLASDAFEITKTSSSPARAARPLLVQSSPSRDDSLAVNWDNAGGRRLAVEALLASVSEGRTSLPVDSARHATFSGYTHGYNRTLLAERAGDLLAAIELASVDSTGLASRGIVLHGDADSSPRVLLAAALSGDRVQRVALEYGFEFDQVVRNDEANYLPGALRWGGMAYFAALIAPRPLLLIGCEEVPEILQRAYAAHAKPGAVRARREVTADELGAWLAGERD